MRLIAASWVAPWAAFCLAFTGTASAQLSGAGDDPDALARELEAADTQADGSVPDPWEGFNRKMFAFNDGLDRKIMTPTAKAYRAVTHKKQRKGFRNFLANLRTPVIFVNDLLQGEPKRAGETLGRFFINSTIGFGGMGDPAERMGIAQHSEDFGQTLAVWGVDSGPYMVLPFLGPSTMRDGFGAGVDLTLDPGFWIATDTARYLQWSKAGAGVITSREPLIEPLDGIRADSLDFYASIRSFYLQSRKREINNGRTTYEDLPDIGDFEEFDELE
ncbi:MlaA family lipoprotein [Hyphococcus sp.]|uniref:MlaA family lipoprotein n=1 Tax=Hyphococcus sp. TaxID=2038636 RepID=UPI0035C68BC3